MGLLRRLRWICACFLLLLAPAGAQDAAQEAVPARPAFAGTSSYPDTSGYLPPWLELSLDVRALADFQAHTGPTEGGLLLGRARLTAAVRPAPWLRVVMQAQDARAWDLSGPAEANRLRDPLEIRLAYLDLGRESRGWRLRLGRQELSLGDERLIAADNEWDPFGPVFDAARLSYSRGRLKLDAFSASPVQPDGHRWPDRSDRASRITGVALEWSTGDRDAAVQPYLFWNRAAAGSDLFANPGRNETVTTGLRAQGPLASSWEYNAEIALQRGKVARDSVSAWAGHGELAWSPARAARVKPRLVWEYNFASGDSDPADGRHATFDDLYSAGYNEAGIPDPFAWRNIRSPGITLALSPARSWNLSSGWRSFWLATVGDSVYPGSVGDSLRNPEATSSHLGSQIFVAGTYSRSERWRFGAGFGHLFSGRYMLQSGQPSSMRTLYLMTAARF